MKTFRLALLSVTLSAISTTAHAELSYGTDINVGAGFSSYSQTSLQGGTGFESEVRENLYVSKNVGFYVGAEYAARPMILNSDKSIGWTGIPFGMLFHWGHDDMLNQMSLGLNYEIPFKDFKDSSGTVGLKNALSIELSSQLLFPITDHFYMGPNIEIAFGLNSPFKSSADRSSRLLNTVFGLSGGFRY